MDIYIVYESTILTEESIIYDGGELESLENRNFFNTSYIIKSNSLETAAIQYDAYKRKYYYELMKHEIDKSIVRIENEYICDYDNDFYSKNKQPVIIGKVFDYNDNLIHDFLIIKADFNVYNLYEIIE